QRVALRCELRPLTLHETAAYVLSRVRAAGGVAAQVFTSNAVTLIHEAAGGLPRTINVIADNALLTGLAADQRPVTSQLVRLVCHALHINPPRQVVPRVPTDALWPSVVAQGRRGDFGAGTGFCVTDSLPTAQNDAKRESATLTKRWRDVFSS